MTKKKRERLEQAADLRLESQIGEEEGFWDLIRRMARENKTAVISFAVIVLMILAASLAPFLTPYEENDMDLLHRLSPPSAEHLLGTDEGGRDVLTRLLYGARVSLLIGVVPALLSLVLGSALGVLAGYRGGLTDAIIMRLADVTLAFPSMLLAMVIMYSLGGGIVDVFLTLTLVNWANVARVVRAQTLQLKSSEYVEAAQVIGVSRATVMRRHILPNCLSTMLVLFTLNVPASILTESSLSFLGLGVQPPNASWGLMINVGRQYLYTAPWLCFAPGAAIMLIVLAFNFLGNGLLDVLDPRLKKQ
ncbi:MAG: ABC transporter permease [Oscillospiraceae bacterium]|nr:ABC transporter permease [Oscillospiraceae bacterium]MBQ1577622.1 ABC transporter permease [Oscillospiraceae bacterium]MBQ2597936.1 ABC transporter permease [Oscillospiraceae bacterium]MBQ3381228.1 ABC transporter permease [Oscillospiraceae bacterium]MBQ5787640.1 ABC transporter permease [Oscillospiraceae bacterium]